MYLLAYMTFYCVFYLTCLTSGYFSIVFSYFLGSLIGMLFSSITSMIFSGTFSSFFTYLTGYFYFCNCGSTLLTIYRGGTVARELPDIKENIFPNLPFSFYAICFCKISNSSLDISPTTLLLPFI